MLNVVIFGAPGVGKGTQAENIINKYNLVHLSTGNILRAEREAGSELGIEAGKLMDAGSLVPDELVIGIISNCIDNAKDASGFIFDGFPRTVPQAEALDKMLVEKGQNITAVVALNAPQEELTKRLLNRAIEQGRADDNEESITKRVSEYSVKTLPVAEFYQGHGKFYSLDGVGEVELIFSRIQEVLDPLAKASV